MAKEKSGKTPPPSERLISTLQPSKTSANTPPKTDKLGGSKKNVKKL